MLFMTEYAKKPKRLIRSILALGSWSLFFVCILQFGLDLQILSGAFLSGICGTLLAEPWR